MVAVKRASAPIPLARLLALAYRQAIDELHSRLASVGYENVRPTYGYVLLALREHPATAVDLAALLGVTKQAASKLVDEMEQAGYVERRSHREDARAKSIVITAQGRKFLGVVESIYEDVEAAWARVIGRKRLEDMRRDLRTVVEAANRGELPAIRPAR